MISFSNGHSKGVLSARSSILQKSAFGKTKFADVKIKQLLAPMQDMRNAIRDRDTLDHQRDLRSSSLSTSLVFLDLDSSNFSNVRSMPSH